MLKLILILILFSGITQAQEQSNISVAFIPAFDRQQFDPIMIVAVTNHGSNMLTNMTVNIETNGLDLNKVAFINSNNFSVQQLNPEETQSFTFQFKYPKTKDDITVYTKIKSDQAYTEVRITVPAILLPRVSWSWSVYPLTGLIALATIYYFKNRWVKG